MKPPINVSPEQAAAHLQPEIWQQVNRLHLRKILCEFTHELIIHPQLQHSKDGWGYYKLPADIPGIEYRFRARILSLDHWYIDTASIEKYVNKESVPPESIPFIIEFRETMGISETVMPVYLEEINSTLCGSAYMHTYNKLTAAALAVSDYQVIEQAMMAGHPCFVANNGRIGFDAGDYRQYAPEAADPFALIWVAANRSRTGYAGVTDLAYDQMIQEELGDDTLASFNRVLEEMGLQAADYYFIPIHPWQWFNKLAQLFAEDITERKLVFLGYGPDQYIPQQSIRTFYNISSPERRYTKTSLSILNMGFMRGLHASFVLTAPPISEWVNAIVESDIYLKRKGFVLLQEVAAVGYTNPHYASIIKDNNYSYNGMLSALWRAGPQH